MLDGGIDFSLRLDPSPGVLSVFVGAAADSASLDADNEEPGIGSLLAGEDELASAVWLSLANDELIIALLLKLSFELFIDAMVRADEDKNRFNDGSGGDNVDDSSNLSGDLSNLLSCG